MATIRRAARLYGADREEAIASLEALKRKREELLQRISLGIATEHETQAYRAIDWRIQAQEQRLYHRARIYSYQGISIDNKIIK